MERGGKRRRLREGETVLFDCKFDPDTQRLHKVKPFRPQNTWNTLLPQSSEEQAVREKQVTQEALRSTINRGKSQNIGTGKNLRLQALHLAGELTRLRKVV